MKVVEWLQLYLLSVQHLVNVDNGSPARLGNVIIAVVEVNKRVISLNMCV